jgi:polar amino acid transport system substrate-binding protein
MPSFHDFFCQIVRQFSFGFTGLTLCCTPLISIQIALAETPCKTVKLKVGVAGAPPFVIYGPDSKNDISGMSLDIWKNIALPEAWESEYIPQKTVKQGLQAVAKGELDILIGSISITPERIQLPNITFTQPYFGGSVGIMVPIEPPSLWSRIAPFFGIAALSSISILVFILFIVGNLIWLAEHKKNPEHFNPKYREGIQNGMWFAIVTLSTVGYGDRVPKTKLGQLITGVWMLVALLTFSTITAGLTSALSAAISEKQNRPIFIQTKDLEGASVAVLQDTTSESWAKFYQARPTKAKTFQEAVNLLRKGAVKAVMFDRPVLLYHVKQHPEDQFYVTEMKLTLEPYGFAIPINSCLEKTLNIHLLNLVYGQEMNTLTERWLGHSTIRP